MYIADDLTADSLPRLARLVEGRTVSWLEFRRTRDGRNLLVIQFADADGRPAGAEARLSFLDEGSGWEFEAEEPVEAFKRKQKANSENHP